MTRKNKPAVIGAATPRRVFKVSKVILMEWKDQYKHPNWQKKRLEALEAAEFTCQDCGAKDKQLHVHHISYKKNSKIWEYELSELSVLCDECHSEAHASKNFLNACFVLLGAGSENTIAKLVSGWIGFDSHPEDVVSSHLEAVGYGAGYLQMFEASTILKMTKINPSDMRKFIEEQSDARL